MTVLIIAVDKRYSQTDPRHLKILLDEKTITPPSKYLGVQEEKQILGEIVSSNVKYDFNWLHKSLCGFRRISPVEGELTYITSFPYMADCNKKGKFFSILDLNSTEIKLDDYYARIISRNGATSFR